MDIDEALVMKNYERISETIRAIGDDKGYLTRIDQLISEVIPFDCETTTSNFAQNSENLAYAKRLLNLSINGSCEESTAFNQALDLVLAHEPTFKLAMYASKKAMISRQLNQTEKYLGIALGQSETKNQESEVYLQLAKTMTLKKQKKEAHNYARQAISKNNSKEAYQLIGNLYMSSFTECVGEKDIVERRSVFIAAYDQFKLANDEKNMALAAAQFPSMEEIHFNNYELGQDLIVSCWFNEKVVLDKRASN